MTHAGDERSAGDRPERRWLGISRGWFLVILLVLVVAVVSARAVGQTFAVGGFTAHNAYKTSAVNSGSLTPPTSLVARATGKSIKLTWTPGATSHKTKQVVSLDHTKATTTCSSADTFATTTLKTPTLTTSAATYTDSTRATKAATTLAGDWYCYQVATGYNTSWTKSAYAHAQAGFVANGVTVSTTLASGTLPKINKATITVTFNQKIGTTVTQLKKRSTGTATGVCGLAKSGSYELLLGDESTFNSRTCKASNKVTFGILKSSVTLKTTKYYTTLTWTVTNTTTAHTYTIKLTFHTTTTPAKATKYTGTPTWTFVPGTSTSSKDVIKSSTSTVTACRTNSHQTALCEPSVTSKTI